MQCHFRFKKSNHFPGDDAIWPRGLLVNAERGGVITGISQPGESVGLYPGGAPGHFDSWVVYAAEESTPGSENQVPTTEVMRPGSGALLLSQDFHLGWYSVPFAVQYQLQMDDDPEFGSPEVDVMLEIPYYAPDPPPPDGTYYWRTRATDEEGRQSPFSPGAEVTIATAEPMVLPSEPIEGEGAFMVRDSRPGGSGLLASSSPSQQNSNPANGQVWQIEYIDTLAPILKSKDSNLICWDGDDETGNRQPWDGPHQNSAYNHSNHSQKFCGIACIAMVNHFYGGDVSQDRITYEKFGYGDPFGDLGHGKSFNWKEHARILSLMLNEAPVELELGKPTFYEIQQWTKERRAVIAGVNEGKHAVVLRGWAIYQGENNPHLPKGTQFVYYNEPDAGRMLPQRYDKMDMVLSLAPEGSPTGFKQEESVTDDFDSDGIMTFDEQKRFGSSAFLADTDDDCVNDKLDMHSFIYSSHNTYGPRDRDWDEDTYEKHLDPDNDDGGVINGVEDANLDGHQAGGETSNFDDDDDGARDNVCTPVPVVTDTPTPTPGAQVPPPTETPATGVSLGGDYLIGTWIKVDDGLHDSGPVCYICLPREMVLKISLESITVSGPSPWVTVSGDLAADGSFSATGRGTVAGFPNIAVALEGQLTPDGLAADYTMGAEGGLPGGYPIVYGLEGERTEPVDTAPPGEKDPGVSQETQGAIQSFVQTFNAAFLSGDVDTLLGRLHPAVIDRYGLPACQAYLESVILKPMQLEVLAIPAQGLWTWERDGRSTGIEDAINVRVKVTVGEQATEQEIHFAPGPDGSIMWFTDCGDPLP